MNEHAYKTDDLIDFSAINGKQDKLTFDSTPISGSNNPVTSGGVYSAISNVEQKVPSGGTAGQVWTSDGDGAGKWANSVGRIPNETYGTISRPDAMTNTITFDTNITINNIPEYNSYKVKRMVLKDKNSSNALYYDYGTESIKKCIVKDVGVTGTLIGDFMYGADGSDAPIRNNTENWTKLVSAFSPWLVGKLTRTTDSNATSYIFVLVGNDYAFGFNPTYKDNVITVLAGGHNGYGNYISAFSRSSHSIRLTAGTEYPVEIVSVYAWDNKLYGKCIVENLGALPSSTYKKICDV